MPDLLLDPLAVEHAPVDRSDVAIAKLGMIVADIDYDDAARNVDKQPPRKIGDGLRRDRKDDDFSGFGGVDNGSGGRADLGRQRGQTLRSSRVRNRDVMAEPGEVACKYPSHASSADDSDSHLDSLNAGIGPPNALSCRSFALVTAPRPDSGGVLQGKAHLVGRLEPDALIQRTTIIARMQLEKAHAFLTTPLHDHL